MINWQIDVRIVDHQSIITPELVPQIIGPYFKDPFRHIIGNSACCICGLTQSWITAIFWKKTGLNTSHRGSRTLFNHSTKHTPTGINCGLIQNINNRCIYSTPVVMAQDIRAELIVLIYRQIKDHLSLRIWGLMGSQVRAVFIKKIHGDFRPWSWSCIYSNSYRLIWNNLGVHHRVRYNNRIAPELITLIICTEQVLTVRQIKRSHTVGIGRTRTDVTPVLAKDIHVYPSQRQTFIIFQW